MKTMKSTARRIVVDPPDFDIKPSSAQDAYDTMLKRGYDVPGIIRYARAAKSWCEKGTEIHTIWKDLEIMCTSPSETKA